MNFSIKRLASAAAGALFVASLCVAATSAPAHAAGLPILRASQNQMAHVCTRLEDDGEQAGVVCADIVTGTDSTGFWARGQVEVVCESDPSGPIIHCPAAQTVFGLYNTTLAADPGTSQNIDGCGSWTNVFDGTVTFGSPCAGNGQRNYAQTAELHWPANEPCTASDVSGSNAVWSDVFGIATRVGYPAKTGIVLPDDPYNLWLLGDTTSGLLESGHYLICD